MNNHEKQRETHQRRLIRDTVLRHKDHPNADDIYFDVHAQDGRISKATVYRNLKLLAENGEILQVKMPGADRFDSTMGEHYHVICRECGTVIDAPIGYFSETDTLVEQQTGFCIERHRTVFEGLCPECQKRIKG